MRSTILAAFALALLAGPAAAAGFEEGVAAYEAGDAARAIELWRPTAEAGDRDAQFNIGILYAEGHGVPEDRARAVEWLTRAAEQGDPIAAFNLGEIHASEEGAAPDYAAAARFYEQAAAQDHPTAMRELAFLLANGRGVEQDVGRAVRLTADAQDLQCLLGDATENFEPRHERLEL